MKRRRIIPYRTYLKKYARILRNNSTKAEIRLWLKLKNKQMHGYDFHRQKPLDSFILDFYCHELNLGIELDGYSHEFLDVFEKDSLKTLKLKNFGIIILRFSDHQVMNDMENVLREIEFYIQKFEEKDSFQ